MNLMELLVIQQPERKEIDILNVTVDNIGFNELLKQLGQGGVVFTPNIDHLVKLQKDQEFYEVYMQADYRVCDSQLLLLASRFLGTPLKEKISGSDLFPAFYKFYAKSDDVKIFLLGGKEGAAEAAQQNINQKVGRKIIVETYCPPMGFENDPEECAKIIQIINESGANVLAVGVGAPKQEKWIAQHKNKLDHKIKTFFAIGATIDFEAGLTQRAPSWISQAGLEWLYRLLSEPKRLWKRYLIDDPVFFFLIALQKLNLYKKGNL